MRNVQLAPRGAALMSVLVNGADIGQPPTRQNLDDWIAAPPIAHTAVMQPPMLLGTFLDFYGVDKEHYFIFELATMKLVSHTQYYVDDALAALEKLLPVADGGP